MIQIAVIGYGYWGPNLVRNFSGQEHARVAAVCDQRADQQAQVRSRYPDAMVTGDVAEVFNHPKIDAVAIATPVSTHYDLALQALRAGKHVWSEKPLAGTSEQCAHLVEEAERLRRVLFVDHTFVYTGAVRKIHQLIAERALGQLYYYDSVRSNLGLFQHDVNVLWDLAVHDIGIVDFLFPERPLAVSATGVSHVAGHSENLAYLTLFFPNQLIAHVHANWLSPVKIRQTIIGGSEKMVLWDDVDASEKVRIYDKGIMINESAESMLQKRIGYRTGDMWAPQIDRTEALATAVKHFVGCIQTGEAPLTDGRAGLRVVRILEAASRSLKERGQVVELSDKEVL